MMWSLEISSPPAIDLLSLDEAKAHLNITWDDDDDLLGDLIRAATEQTESHLSRSLLTQTVKLRLNRWPSCGKIYLPRSPVQSVSSISYKEAVAGADTTLSSSLYTVVGARTTPDAKAPLAYIQPAYGQSWPSLYSVPENVTVTYVAGWLSAEDVPVRIKQAAKIMLSDLYENRESRIVGTIVANLSTVDDLLANERIYHDFGEDCS
jgi:uncharacterized phiE125 gp8 family phage protein